MSIINLDNNKSISIICKGIIISIAVIVCLRHIICFDVSVLSLFKFFGFILLFVQLQGFSVLTVLNIRPVHFSGMVMTSFFLGVAVLFTEYFIAVALGTNTVFYIGLIVTIICLVRNLIVCKYNYSVSFLKIQTTFFFFVTLLLILSMIDVQLSFIRPELSEVSNTYQDYLYHMSLINAISLDYPINNPDLYGEIIHYHFFSDLLCAIPMRLLGLSSKFIVIDCMPYLNTSVVAISLYSFYKYTTRNSKATSTYAILTLCSFAGIPFFAAPYLLCHTITNINAIGLGISALCCFIVNLCEWEKAKAGSRAHYSRVILLCILISLVVGIKAPFGIVAIAALWGTFVLGFFFGEFNSHNIIVLLSITICGMLIYLVFVGMESSGGSTIGFFLTEKAKAELFWEPFKAVLISLQIPILLRKIILTLTYIILLFGVYCILFVIAYLRELILVLKKKKTFELSKVLVYAMIPVALLVFETVVFPDYRTSEGYFFFIVTILVPVVVFWFIEDIQSCKHRYEKAIIGLFVICSCVGLISMGLFMNSHMFKGIYNAKVDNQYDTISSLEYEGMCWIRDNTPQNALLAVDRYQRVAPELYDHNVMHHNTFFGYSAYSQRNCYIEGSGYTLRVSRADEIGQWLGNNKKLYDPQYEKRGKLAKELGIDYVVVSKRLYPFVDLSCNEYSRCYSNKDLDIYKIK